MKTWAVHTSLLLAICVATYLYNRKFAAPSRRDMVIASLEGAHKHLRKGAAIKFVCNVPENAVADKDVFYLANNFTQFALAPVSLNQPPSVGSDTTLIVSPVGMAGRVSDSVRNTAAILWENKDTAYHYLLIHLPDAP